MNEKLALQIVSYGFPVLLLMIGLCVYYKQQVIKKVLVKIAENKKNLQSKE